LGARQVTEVPEPLKVPADALHASCSRSIGDSASRTVAVTVTFVSASSRSVLTVMDSITGTRLGGGGGGGGGGSGRMGESPHDARNPISITASNARSTASRASARKHVST
jgi:hypothetical protein